MTEGSRFGEASGGILAFIEGNLGSSGKSALSDADNTLYSCAKDLKALLRSLQER